MSTRRDDFEFHAGAVWALMCLYQHVGGGAEYDNIVGHFGFEKLARVARREGLMKSSGLHEYRRQRLANGQEP